MDEQSTSDPTTIFNTKVLMIASAFFLGILGLMASFLPELILESYGNPANGMGVVLLKITGALYLGFAVLNWMARGNIIGGIYSRPVALGNFFHFVIVAIILLKFLITSSANPIIIAGTVLYSIFGVCFGYILFANGKSCG